MTVRRLARLAAIAGWAALISFPFGWPGRFSPEYRAWFDALFQAEVIHLAGHLVMFAGLTLLLSRLEVVRQNKWTLLFIVVGLGCVQEGFQLLAGGRAISPAMWFDLLTDAVGGLAGWMLARRLFAGKEPAWEVT